MGFATIAASLLLAAQTPAAPCRPIDGWAALLAKPDLRWIVVGELHGTAEAPAIFADAVCLTAQSRKVTVAIEHPAADQPAVDRFLASDGGAAAQAALLAGGLWSAPTKDGRTSKAMLALLETLRRMKAAGRVERVVAFVPALQPGPSQGPYETAMAEQLQAEAAPGSTTLVLVGNLHAMRTEVGSAQPFMPMASRLPPAATITLDVVGEGGEAWNCGRDGCAPHPAGPASGHTRGVELGQAADAPYSGNFYTGAPFTAATPAVTP